MSGQIPLPCERGAERGARGRSNGARVAALAVLPLCASVVAACGAPPSAANARSAERAPNTAPASVEAEPSPQASPPEAVHVEPEPPDPGHAIVRVRGALSVQVEGTGVLCGPTDGGQYISVSSTELVGPCEDVLWRLAVMAPDDSEAPSAGFETWPHDAQRPRRTAPAREVRIEEREGQLHVAFTADTSMGEVQVDAELRCPVDPFGELEDDQPVEVEFPPDILRLVGEVSGLPVRRYATCELGRAQNSFAVSVIVPRGDFGDLADPAVDLVRRLRERLPPGWVAYRSTDHWSSDDENHDGVEVAVAPVRSQYDILRHAGTDPGSHMPTEAIVRALERYDEAFGIEILGATYGTVLFALRRPPRNPDAFNRALPQTCPRWMQLPRHLGSDPLVNWGWE